MSESKDAPPTAARAPLGDVDSLSANSSPSWTDFLTADPEAAANAPNHTSREVKSGHYVPVKPSPLGDPRLVVHSASMAAALGLSEAACLAPRFASFFSGDVDVLAGFMPWATPYALSIYGQPVVRQCPFGNGNGYGDGRAISLGEVVFEGDRWEMQLKGAGPTPFCRGADGRAVLRSSVREFLASEAMHHLGVSTTRALSLVVSGADTVQRPWYSNKDQGGAGDVPSLDDPRIAHVPLEYRKMLLAELASKARGPDVMVREQCAITCRTAPSFFRVGHIELLSRRIVRATKARGAGSAEAQTAVAEFRRSAQHLLDREFPDIAAQQDAPLPEQLVAMLRASSQQLATLTAGWLRVGFVQGNFNSDNCLVAGRTMDYGPFGFMQRYESLWNMWESSGDHFGYMNQPTAGGKNLESLATAVRVVLDLDGNPAHSREAAAVVEAHAQVARDAVDDAFRRKLGLSSFGPDERALFAGLGELMETSEADFTIFWRQLADVAEVGLAEGKEEGKAEGIGNTDAWWPLLDDAFYAPLTAETKAGWAAWLGEWMGRLREEVSQDGSGSPEAVAAGMRLVSPKYVPREWMLVTVRRLALRGG